MRAFMSAMNTKPITTLVVMLILIRTSPRRPCIRPAHGRGGDRDDTEGPVAADLTGHGNDGKIVDAEHLSELNGRRGVLRFDGKSSYVDCGDDESIYIGGDMSFEMWVRRNDGPRNRFAPLFTDSPQRSFSFQISGFLSLVLLLRHDDPDMAPR